ncbi:acyltransferase domain-containing protein [Streptomyces sp. NBC_00503]|uniref:acyltransferase domain-containing protein n=1 Tax=Streptomyces sp. NBC_00503 TaxID=2903659 RepID=UPI002E820870|nr:acyltransferase domain-containing protein [Streptomyces sp. NBC_00503]WUD79141.1 acyltransferase domain-containing protein [Streptomyces sp. NBC_00503]
MGIPEGIETVVGLVPGQGSYRRGCLDAFRQREDANVAEVFETIDTISTESLGRKVTPLVFGANAPEADELLTRDPDVLQLATFGVSVSIFRVLASRGVRPEILLGHSFGEFAALVCGGAYSLADGVRMLCHRGALLHGLAEDGVLGPPGGRMLSLSCNRERAGLVLDLLGEATLTVAVENGHGQTVVSGSSDAVGRLAGVAAALGIDTRVLTSPYPFHNRLLAGMGSLFAEKAAGLRQQPLEIPVFSPITGRFYRDSDRLAELLSAHLVQPVRFGSAIGQLSRGRAAIYLELGGGSALTSLVSQISSNATCLAPLRGGDADVRIRHVVDFLRGGRQDSEPVGFDADAADSVPTARRPAEVAKGTGTKLPEAVVRVESAEREDVLATLRGIFAEALEYPEEVFTGESELEADLGIDSLRQTELVTRLVTRFDLPSPAGGSLGARATVDSVVDLIVTELSRSSR